jgi:competence protein CoiA
MQYALVAGQREEARPELSGVNSVCPYCREPVIAKCGDVRVAHWAHFGKRTCDVWWEPETDWHRGWKDHFPNTWREVIHYAPDGEKHVADVKTESGIVLEFQHSPLSRDERESRESFYPNMAWVVDALRRVRDRRQFLASLDTVAILKRKPLVISLPSNQAALLRDWSASWVPVFFDFGDPILWRLNHRSPHGRAYLSPVLKTAFLNAYVKGQGLKGMNYWAAAECFPALIVPLLANSDFLKQVPQGPRADGFRRYLARKQRAQPRF